MKKVILAVLVAFVTFSAPAFAGGVYRKAPHYHGGHHHNHNHDLGHNLADGLAFLIKLPIRIVTSTTTGVVGVVTNQNLEGFERGYNLI